jgi:hypothetical protein
MKKLTALATAGIFVLALQGPGGAQKEVQPPPVPPMLEGNRPLVQPQTRESAAPQKLEEEQAKPKATAGKKNQRLAKSKKSRGKKTAATKPKGLKTAKKKRQAATP